MDSKDKKEKVAKTDEMDKTEKIDETEKAVRVDKIEEPKKMENRGKNKHFITSLEFAFKGIQTVFEEERNMRKHVLLGGLAMLAGVILGLDRLEWLWIFLAVFLVWIVEIINTVFENVVDMCTECHYNAIGKKIKDMAAGAVLLTSIFAVIVGLIIFLPKILEFLDA
ncbi:diacylglycerol kinase [Enterococcus sp. AZ071]